MREGEGVLMEADQTCLFGLMRRIGRAIVATFGERCEVVMHDLRNPEASIVFIEGNVTGRDIGGPATDLLLKEMQRGTREDVLSYRTYIGGKPLRSSSLLFGADEGGPAALCINFDVSDLISAEEALRSLRGDTATITEDVEETFARDFVETLETMIARVVHEIGTPINRMDRSGRVRVVEMLEEGGAFEVKKAVPVVAEWLGVSRSTLYGYLNEVWARKRKQSS